MALHKVSRGATVKWIGATYSLIQGGVEVAKERAQKLSTAVKAGLACKATDLAAKVPGRRARRAQKDSPCPRQDGGDKMGPLNRCLYIWVRRNASACRWKGGKMVRSQLLFRNFRTIRYTARRTGTNDSIRAVSSPGRAQDMGHISERLSSAGASSAGLGKRSASHRKDGFTGSCGEQTCR